MHICLSVESIVQGNYCFFYSFAYGLRKQGLMADTEIGRSTTPEWCLYSSLEAFNTSLPWDN